MLQADRASHLEQEALIDEVLELQRRLALALQRSAMPEWVELELTMAQFKTAFVVAQKGPLSVNTIAEILGVTQSTVSHLLDRLEQVAIVERIPDTEDRRRTLVQLASRGTALMETLRQGQRGDAHALLSRLAPEDLRALVQGFRAILRLTEPQPKAP
ncbi:MAG: MarR family transcriptional regulator [Chloroflexales bacterium]|nr:MarR family transcriptional regulator [Chloroflexales bacterium]